MVRNILFLLSLCTLTQLVYSTDENHGDTQLENMLRARPNMLFGKESSHEALGELREVICKLFEGSSAGLKIYWNDEEPSLYGAHKIPTRKRDASIMVRSREPKDEGTLVPGERQWAVAVFEMYNIEGWKSFLDLQIDVIINNIPEEEFIKRLARIEYSALEKLADFYREIWLPFAKENKMPTTERFWVRTRPQGFEQWYSEYSDSSLYIQSSKGHYAYITQNAAQMPETFKNLEQLQRAYYPVIE